MTKPAAQLDSDRKNPFQLAAVKFVTPATPSPKPPAAVESPYTAPPEDAISKNAALSPLYRPKKTSTTVRIDSDVLLWLRADGKGYQSRINAILRRAMIESLNSNVAK
jgi:uncharacterized protein (DUF4415 family)